MSLAKPMQARSEQTLQKILNACERLLAEQSFEQISMQKIAKEAGVSVGNLYNRFPDKDGLVNHVVTMNQQRVFDALASDLAQADTESDIRNRLQIFTDSFQKCIQELRPLFATIAARNARGLAMEKTAYSKSDRLIDLATEWVMDIAPELDVQRCRFALTTITTSLQFNLIFQTGERLFGRELGRQLAEQAFCYLSNNEGVTHEQ